MKNREHTLDVVLTKLDAQIELLNELLEISEKRKRLLQTQRDLLVVPDVDTFR